MSAPPKYPCGLCGRKRPAAQMVYSRFSGTRYCAVEQTKCEQRGEAARKRRLRDRARAEELHPVNQTEGDA